MKINYMCLLLNTHEKSIKGIAREINELALKARNKQLSQEDMSGGTFTVIIPVHLGPFHQWEL